MPSRGLSDKKSLKKVCGSVGSHSFFAYLYIIKLRDMKRDLKSIQMLVCQAVLAIDAVVYVELFN